ncbi:MAG: succinylglutamate desuccinylase/aspartoacylase family protein [SAR324 cluster bacterium]|nr:succinylglutamate desuccinylase/aspartoacylase family protein [SAR324 cluster bacterium]
MLRAQDSQDILYIGGQPIQRGEESKIIFDIARLPTHTELGLPVYVYRAEKAGPVLLITATIHGDEVNGLEIIRRMMKSKTIRPEKGTVIAVPIVNAYGFLFFSRHLPDGKDLNRSFPGSKRGSLARQIAYLLMEEVLPHADYGIDLHTGGARRHNYPQVRSDFEDPESIVLAAAFSPPLIVASTPIDKTFRKEAAIRKKPILVYEAGETLRLNEMAVQEGIDGILRTMHFLGMIDSAPQPNQSIWIRKRRWIRASEAGFFHSSMQTGSYVTKNQYLGFLSDPYGNFENQIHAPANGYILGINNMPVVHKGDALFHLGQEESYDATEP